MDMSTVGSIGSNSMIEGLGLAAKNAAEKNQSRTASGDTVNFSAEAQEKAAAMQGDAANGSEGEKPVEASPQGGKPAGMPPASAAGSKASVTDLDDVKTDISKAENAVEALKLKADTDPASADELKRKQLKLSELEDEKAKLEADSYA